MATILLTGGSGLIGRWAVRHLNLPGMSLHVLSHADGDLLEAGTPSGIVEALKPDWVVHLAWCASGTPGYRSSPDNDRWVGSTMELRAACARVGARLVATGTVQDGRSDLDDAYTGAKRELRRILEEDIARDEITWLRPFYVFDPDAGRPRLIADALVARARGEALVLESPSAVHDFVHAADVGRAISHVLQHRLTGRVDVGTGELRSVSSVIDALGLSWISGRRHQDGGQYEDAADIRPLTGTGWSPDVTNKFFEITEEVK